MIKSEPPTSSPFDAHLAWIDRHTSRILAAGALVATNIVVVSILTYLYAIGPVSVVLVTGLASALFLLLHRAVTRMTRHAIGAARRQSAVSKQLSQLVEQIGVEPAGLRGTVDALTVGAQATGAEVFVWDAGARALWSPVWGFDVVLSGAETRAMIESCRIRGVRRVADASSPACGLPAAIAQRGGARALAFAPMCSAGEFFGVVLRRYGSVAELERAEDEVLLASIAALGAVAIGKAAIVDREHERARDNELLLRSMHAASETRQRDRLTDYIQQAVEAVRTSRGVMFALDAGRLKLVGHSGIERLVVASAGSLRLGSTLVEELQRSGVTPIGCRVSQLDEPTSIVLSRLGFGENITAQLLRDTAGIVGVVVLDADYEALDLNAQTLVAAIGRQASLAVERQRMLRSIRKRSRHLACTPKLARSLTGQRDSDAIARIAARELHDGFGFGRVTIAYASHSPEAGDPEIRVVATSGAQPATATGDESVVCMTDALHECISTGRPYVCVSRDVEDATPDAADATGCDGRIVVPIAGHDRRVIGAIAVYERDPDVLGEDDLHMLETIADQLGGTLEQSQLYETLERSYFETVEALSSALEAKDAYTLDHARSITDMSADVGRRLGMREEEIRDLKLGALLHDIGKIGVPTEILSKPGPLTDEEFEVMKEHTVIGEQIIASVEFLQGVRPLVLHEHERWDGRGYPHQLAGEEIPLGARIIFVCDSWHAMTSDRPYRNALSNDEAMRRLREGAGSQFDPAVVETFCELMETTQFAAAAHTAVTK